MSVDVNKFGLLADKFLSDTFASAAQTIDIQEIVKTDDGQGGASEYWSTIDTVKCFAFPEKGTEKSEAGRIYADQFYGFQLKPITGLSEKNRIIFDCREYDIMSIIDVASSGQWIKVHAERQANG